MPATALRYALTRWDEAKKKGVFTATMEWELSVTISNDVADMAPSKVAGLFAWLPIEGSLYVSYNSLWPLVTCRGVSCVQIEGGVYRYSTEWSDENAKDDGSGDSSPATNEDPLLDLPIIKPVASSRDRAITRDRNNKIILNKAGDPVAQSVDDNTIGISVTANVPVDGNAEAVILALRNRVNDAPIQVGRWYADTNMVRVIFSSNPLSEVKRRNEIEYLEMSFELQIDERDKHNGTPLNAGFRQKVWTTSAGVPIASNVDPNPGAGDKFTLERILDDDGSEPGEPVPLDDFGRKVANPTPDTAVYLDVEKYEEGDFTELPGVIAWAGP